MDHYFLLGGGRGCEKLPQKIPPQQKMLKNGTRETMGKKHLASAFYYYYNVKKLLVHKLIGHQNNHCLPTPLHKNNGKSACLFYLFFNLQCDVVKLST